MTDRNATFDVQVSENVWITLSDGIRLAARVWRPVCSQPVPAILTYSPYFARFFSRGAEDARFPYYAARGYACVRVDIRGTGNSEGRPLDEYVKQEQDDGVEVIKWISEQPWCSGAVGVEGISWSGINALQLASRRPAALKAVITHCSTDDRYADDAHYKGGCILYDMLIWGTLFLAFQGQAPDPEIVGEQGWRERWLGRLNAIECNLSQWIKHQHNDAFWKHGSVCNDYSQIACPVYAMGGWVDGYKNSVFRLMEGLQGPRKGLIGPWTHMYPHRGLPGPPINYLDESLRWWDFWLKDINTGIADEPMLRVWMQQRAASPGDPSVNGHWVAEREWPSTRIRECWYFLGSGNSIKQGLGEEREWNVVPERVVGLSGGLWCPGMVNAGELEVESPSEQSADDRASLVFETASLEEPVEILGAPVVLLYLQVDEPVAQIAIRLNEVLETGESHRVSYAILNLCHRKSSENPSAITSGDLDGVRVQLDFVAHRFKRGSRIRIAISSSYWPMAIPAPRRVRLSVKTGLSKLALPQRLSQNDDGHLRPFGPPIVPTSQVDTLIWEAGHQSSIHDPRTEHQSFHRGRDRSVSLLREIDARISAESEMHAEMKTSENVAFYSYCYELGWEKRERRTNVVATSKLTAQEKAFHLEATIKALEGNTVVFEHKWEQTIDRDLV